ncbi:helix-turn-helix domain-containing protein [Streptomyces sp. NPDC048385]|uniref:helix-turn-helix domain-containing protein n=1 Tax=unclassified Streptomyces TaxID=2593676 RepID=UPI003417D62E
MACWTSPPRTADLRAREPKAIHRALRVLEAVAEIGPGATAKEVSQALEYPTATTYRLLNLLVQDGYLVRMPDLRGFALGRKVTALAGYVEAARVPTAVRALLEELRGQIRAGIHLIRIYGGRLTFVDTDDVFPPPALDAVRILRTEDLTALVHEATDLPSLVAPILDHSGQTAACLLLVGRPSPPPGDREARILSEYAERLTR